MSKYPNAIDDDSTLPPVNDNLDDIGAEAINAVRDSVINIEQFVGTGVPGQMSLAARIGVIVNPQGILNASVITSLGLVTLPIYNSQIAEAAGIQESKLQLDYPTNNLFNYIRDLAKDVNLSLGWIATEGVKLDPHLIGAIYRHDMTQIDVIENSVLYLNNVFRVNRDNTSAYSLANDMNNELLAHQWADGTQLPNTKNITTNSGAFYPSNYAHVASGIYLDSNGFAVIPQTVTDVQSALNYIDQNSLTLLGSRVQNLYSNGISVNSRSSALDMDGYGPIVVSSTPAIAYLRGTGTNTFPTDDIVMGDDMIQLFPTGGQQAGYLFDAQFALIRTGDIIIVNYTNDGYGIEIPYVISEKKYISTPSESYFIRIAGKNIIYSPAATVTIYRPLFNNNKYGVLSVASGIPTNPSSGVSLVPTTPSLIVGNPNGAQCAGVGFNPDQFDSLHYLLYLELYPFGNPLDGYTVMLPGIDVTGNQGATPGLYTLNSIVQATNNQFRQPGYNYRFTAFEFQGDFGIIADPYNNASFSVISAPVYNGAYADGYYPNNVIDLFPVSGASVAQDPLGLGPNGSGVASPPFSGVYDKTQSAAGFPTRVFNALQQNNYYVNGAERQNLNSDVYQSFDIYGDGYWPAITDGYYPGSPQSTIYNIALDLSSSGLKAGKTIVVQPYENNLGNNQINYGRFVIQNVQFLTCSDDSLMTQITVFNSVHGTGSLASTVAPSGSPVAIYFSSDSVSFDNETSIDFSNYSAPIGSGNFKRHFEVYADQNGNTYTHERARIALSPPYIAVNSGYQLQTTSTLSQLDIVSVSSTLRGYVPSGYLVNSITLCILGLSTIAGTYDGYMWDGVNANTAGPFTIGRIGEVTRFYDQTNIDYIDVVFGLNNTVIQDFGPQLSPPTLTQSITFQLFPSLASDQEVMIIASCQENTSTSAVTQIQDLREFGNISPEQLTTSALNYISAGDKYLHFNGVIRGFGIASVPVTGVSYGMVSVNGGLALVDGNLAPINNQVFVIPPIAEVDGYGNLYPINYALCVNSEGELVTVALTNSDPIVGTNSGTPRLVWAVNRTLPGNPKYQIDCCDFSYLLNDRKDLTILYIISSVVTGSGSGATTALTIRDVRRFVNDADSSLPAVVTNDKSQGNFESLSSAIAWLYFNTAYQSTVQVKGIQTLSYTDALPSGLQLIGVADGATIVVNNPTGQSITLNNITFSNLFITVTSYNAFTLGSNVTFDNCTFIYDCDASVGTPPVAYNIYDFANAGCGLIYANLIASGTEMISNINITNCTFGNVFPNYFPFISIQFSDAGAMAQNINISNNTILSDIPNDLRAAIVFSSILTTNNGNTQSIYPANPKIVNVFIEDNICNQSQMILVSGLPDTSQYMSYSYLTSVNSHISGNTCGTIGYFIAANDTADSYNVFSSAEPVNIRNQFDDLTISGNTCHLIASLNIYGHFIPFLINNSGTYVATVLVPTGQVDITNNIVSWICVGAYNAGSTGQVQNQGQGVHISGNRVSPGDPAYLGTYVSVFAALSPVYVAEILPVGINLLLGSYNTSVPDYDNSQSLISGNILSTNDMYVANSTSTMTGQANGNFANNGVPYYYLYGILVSNNALVTNNVVNQCVEAGCLIQILSLKSNVVVTNNNLIRGILSIAGYVGGTELALTSKCVITDNVFDSIYVDSANTVLNDTYVGTANTPDLLVYIPANWTYERNTNQISYASIPLYNYAPTLNLFPLTSNLDTGSIPGLASGLIFDGTGVAGFSFLAGDDFIPINIPLDQALPSGVKFLYATLGLACVTQLGSSPNQTYNGPGTITTNSLPLSSISMKLTVNANSRVLPPSNPTGYVTNTTDPGGLLAESNADVHTVSYTSQGQFTAFPPSAIIALGSNPGVSDINAGTVYLLIDGLSSAFVMSGVPIQINTGTSFQSMISIYMTEITSSSAVSLLLMSPLVIRYAWL